MNDIINIGRALENDIVIDQSYGRVSNEHASIQIQDGQLIFIDHSSNGTLINGRMIHNQSIGIQNGDLIILANEYKLSWSDILKHFPSLQRKTERFDGSQVIRENERKTEVYNKDSQQNDASVNGSNVGKKYIDVDTSSIGQLSDYTQFEVDEYLEKFNYGACLSSWMWAICQHIYWPLLIIPISLVPYIGQVCSLFLCAYLGINGNKLAWRKSTDRQFGQFVRRQRKWVVMGVFLLAIFAAIQVFSFYYL